MKRRLFWKILFGFWLTTMIITQSVWLLFAFLRPLEQNDNLKGMARMMIAAASSAIELGGQKALTTQMAAWPGYLRSQITVQPETGNLPKATPASIIVRDHAGAQYRITYKRRTFHYNFFDIPKEVVIISILGGLVFSAILAWYMTNPIRRMRTGFGRLAQGDFATRLGPAVGRRRDEIADLAHDFDRMAERLEELVTARDRLLAGVSHELRSPLARLQLAIGLARQDPTKLEVSLQRIDREAARLDEMVGELLTLSKLESGVGVAEEYFDIAEIVKIVVEDARFEAEPLGVDVTMDIDPAPGKVEWLCAGSGKLISHAIENIVRNALRFSARGQKVQIRLVAPGDGMFELTVADQGPGVSDEMLGTLFQPFIQGGDGKGFGLGLAIAKRAIIAHGGTITARNKFPNGLVVSASLPAAKTDTQFSAR